jgi:hypothetical protein
VRRSFLIAFFALLSINPAVSGERDTSGPIAGDGKAHAAQEKPGGPNHKSPVWDNLAAVFAAGRDYKHEGCNTVSYGTAPGLRDTMIGRVINGDSLTSGCNFETKGKGTSLSMVQMDWKAMKVNFLYKILDTSSPVSVEAGRHTVNSAYDASVAPFGGEYWVAFECATGTTSACVGPLVRDPSSQRIEMDMRRISVVVSGICGRGQPVCYAAAVPKIAAFRGRLYLYWDSLASDHTGKQRNDWTKDQQKLFFAVDIRGAELAKDPASGRMYRAGQRDSIPVNSDATSVEVLANADMFQVIESKGKLIATAGLTQRGNSIETTCAMPLNHVPDCYRLIFAEADTPLGHHGFKRVSGEGTPRAPQAYSHFVYKPETGETMLAGQFFNPDGSGGGKIYTWPEKLLKPACDLLRGEACPSAGRKDTGHGSDALH